MAKREPILSIDLGDNGGLLNFHSPDEIVSFTRRERSFYGFVSRAGIGRDLRNTIDSLVGQPDNSASELQGAPGRGTGAVEAQLRSAFIEARLPVSVTPAGQFLDRLVEEHGSAEAVGALLYLSGKLGGVDLSSPGVLRGSVLAALFEAGIAPKAAAASKRSLDQLAHRYASSLAKADDQLRENTHRTREVYARALRYLRRHRNKKNAELDAARAEFKKVQDTYEQFMQLRGPVDYWTKKSATHRANAFNYQGHLLTFAKFAGLTVVGVLSGLALVAFLYASFSTPDKPSTIYLVLVTLGVVVTTMAFWAARVLVRLYMSEHHLAIDADERATMVMTYLALTEKNAADEKERALVLASLFRPTSDGIVKDDAAPDIGPAAILSKIIDRRP